MCCPYRAHTEDMRYLPKVSRILCAYLGLDCAAPSVRKMRIVRLRDFIFPNVRLVINVLQIFATLCEL